MSIVLVYMWQLFAYFTFYGPMLSLNQKLELCWTYCFVNKIITKKKSSNFRSPIAFLLFCYLFIWINNLMRKTLICILGIDRGLKYLSIDTKCSILTKIELLLNGLWRQNKINCTRHVVQCKSRLYGISM